MTIRPVCFAIALALAACGNQATTGSDGSGAANVAADIENAAKAAQQAAREASDKVTELTKAHDDLMKQIDKAVDDSVSATSDADRTAAKELLDKLRKAKVDLDAQLAGAGEAAARLQRAAGVHIRKECLDNPLAKGC